MELLAPVGNFKRLGATLTFRADTVCLATEKFGMRAGPTNSSPEELATVVQAAHWKGTRAHMTYNTLPRVDEFDRLPDLLRYARQVGVDALIVTDLGVTKLAQKYAPNAELHVSTQAGVVNHEAARVFYEMGASRMVLARELSMDEIAQIRAKTPPELELEAFVHGSMCVSFSGRCLLLNCLTGRGANRGGYAQPCHWSHRLVEEERLGEYFPIEEDDRGTHILNSRDICMIRHIPELQKAEINSLKIEGRAKSAYYVAVTVNTYRSAIDFYEQHPDELLPEWIPKELNRVSHREYSTGFHFGTSGQVHQNGGYVRDYKVAAVCKDWENGMAILPQRNRFFRGDTADVLEPGTQPYLLTLDKLYDVEMAPIGAAPHATVRVLAKTRHPVKPGTLLRRMRDE